MTVLSFLLANLAVSIIGLVVLVYLLLGLKVVKQYERGVLFTLGTYKGLMQPGLREVFPIVQSWRRVDIRTKTIDVPDQETITKDNVSVRINAVLYYKVTDATKAILEVLDFMFATSQVAQTTLRDIVGMYELDDVLTQREKISKRIQEVVDKATDPWGIKVEAVELKHIEVPTEMQRVMARQAEAERERKAVIIRSEGEVVAADNLAKAALNLVKFPGGLHLRTLQSINDLSSDESNTVVYAIPKELLVALKKIGGGKL